MTTPRYRQSGSPLDLGGAWQQLGEIAPDELTDLRGGYLQLGRPVGGEAWSFGLWVVFGTFAATN